MGMIILNNIGKMKNLIHKILKEEFEKDQHLYDTSDENFKHMLGKRVCVKTNFFRDKQGVNRKSNNGNEVCGILKFAGINPTHGKFQATVDKTPVFPIKPEDIKLM
jgi:hypothetical protein